MKILHLTKIQQGMLEFSNTTLKRYTLQIYSSLHTFDDFSTFHFIFSSINNSKECTNEKLVSSNFKNILKVLYIGKPSIEYKKKLEKLLNNYIEDFKVIFTTSKVGNYFSNQDKTSHELKSNVVYEYKCYKNKSIQYIGFTSRPLIEIVKEYLKGKSAISDHISNCNNCKN